MKFTTAPELAVACVHPTAEPAPSSTSPPPPRIQERIRCIIPTNWRLSLFRKWREPSSKVVCKCIVSRKRFSILSQITDSSGLGMHEGKNGAPAQASVQGCKKTRRRFKPT